MNIQVDLPKGFVPLQAENGSLTHAACFDNGRFHGWLMRANADGNWVSVRKLETWEVMQAEDQRDYGIIQGS